MKRRTALALIASLPLATVVRAQSPSANVRLGPILEKAGSLGSLKAVIVSVDGNEAGSRAYNGSTLNGSTNIKSASKSIISALVGIAIDRKILEGADQPIASVLRADFPSNPDPRLERVTIGNLLSMQSGLERMSGPNYGRWVSSRNWVRTALGSGFAGEPGGGMLYSTGSTHLLSAILTKASGRSTLALARDWFKPLDGFSIGSWERDPQGIYLGGNQMAMTARSLLAFGELYRRGGVTADGARLISQSWIDQSWMRRTNSVFNGDGYGYCWFIKDMAGEKVFYAWGYGGQMLYIVPSKKLSVVMTSREDAPSARTGYRDELHGLMSSIISVV
ncbi:serine hydrolase domain-containing protein [Agrobacterium larrymoorei]|uniref:Serine hydrolase n=1 Tax=Agrobacterium larrymoorei TaxID=160699 RepID=A0A4D7E030_9HYPH|nr:serine hydrolase [Agrobacterium larrymoorei]QCI97590.1 serine hydrolase [Agrobacterium larrymoorei]QYA06969.1 serine hydrolase [Agrobacterium larrymoorei]